LEQILQPADSERSYLAFKMAIRAAWMLGSSPENRKQVFEACKKAYGIRSNVAHGRSSGMLLDDELEDLYLIEDYLRLLVRMYLDKPDSFTEANLNSLCLGVDQF